MTGTPCLTMRYLPVASSAAKQSVASAMRPIALMRWLSSVWGRERARGAMRRVSASIFAKAPPAVKVTQLGLWIDRKEKSLAEVRAMCAIGQRGQLGLNGRLPWEGNKGREYVADVARFFEVTRGHVIIAGPITIASIPAFAYEDRTICEIRSTNAPAEVLAWFPNRVVYVGGGPPVWQTYAPFIRHWDITRLPYDGEADRWFDPAWLIASGNGA